MSKEQEFNNQIIDKKEALKYFAGSSIVFTPFTVGGAEFIAFFAFCSAAIGKYPTDPVIFPLAAVFGITSGVGLSALVTRWEFKDKKTKI